MVKTVYVAMSGGVDSSVAAALLMKQGYRVVGIFMKNWEGDPKLGYCPWEEDQEMVERVAKHLGIPWKTCNFSQKYAKTVIEPFFFGYKNGLTPNPDTLCNKEIKFGEFLLRALEEGATYIATGHYAKLEPTKDGLRLKTPKDTHKDQTYFLYQLNRWQLSKSLFPLGDYTKKEVRRIAKTLGLPNAERPDSQGICFVGEVPIRKFLGKRFPKKPGPIISTDGVKIGTHDGHWFYTIGQRHGLKIGGGIPYYVVEKDAATNTLIVSPGFAPELYKKEMVVGELNWIAKESEIIKRIKKSETIKIKVRFRHGQDPQPARLYSIPSINLVNSFTSITSLRVVFDTPQRAIAPGQAAVFYKGKIMIGGGVIQPKVTKPKTTVTKSALGGRLRSGAVSP